MNCARQTITSTSHRLVDARRGRLYELVWTLGSDAGHTNLRGSGERGAGASNVASGAAAQLLVRYAYTRSSQALSAASLAAASTPSTNRCALMPTTLP